MVQHDTQKSNSSRPQELSTIFAHQVSSPSRLRAQWSSRTPSQPPTSSISTRSKSPGQSPCRGECSCRKEAELQYRWLCSPSSCFHASAPSLRLEEFQSGFGVRIGPPQSLSSHSGPITCRG